MTQPIQSDRPASPIADRDRPAAARAAAARSPGTNDSAGAAPAVDTADVSQASVLLRSAAPGSGAIGNADQARALAARVREAMAGDPARAVQAYSAVHREDVEALLVATA